MWISALKGKAGNTLPEVGCLNLRSHWSQQSFLICEGEGFSLLEPAKASPREPGIVLGAGGALNKTSSLAFIARQA